MLLRLREAGLIVSPLTFTCCCIRRIFSKAPAVLLLAGILIGSQCAAIGLTATRIRASSSHSEAKSELNSGREETDTNNNLFDIARDSPAGVDRIVVSAKKDRRRAPPKKSGRTNPPTTPESEINVTSPLLDAITQNTPGYSEGYALGVPKRFEWCSGSYKPAGYSGPPADFTAVTGWGAVYPKAGSPAYSNSDATIEIANAKTYVHLKATREWILVQDQTKLQIVGAHFVADFVANASIQMRSDIQPDGSVAIGAPPTGYNDHFWFTERGTYPAGSVDGVYVQMDIRKNDPKVSLVANVGADWWRNASADYVHGFSNNPGAGMSNWVELSTQWSTLRFYSWTASQLQEDPPPPLVETTMQARPAFTRRLSNSAPHCFSRSRQKP